MLDDSSRNLVAELKRATPETVPPVFFSRLMTLPPTALAGRTSLPASPVSGVRFLSLAASETRLRLPLAEPAALGTNFTVNAILCPAATLAGKASPLIEYAVLLTLACEIVTTLPPVLVTVSERLAWLPTWALPNANNEPIGRRRASSVVRQSVLHRRRRSRNVSWCFSTARQLCLRPPPVVEETLFG